MGGLDLNVCYETKKHGKDSTCPYAKKDDYVLGMIRELYKLCGGENNSSDEESSEEDPHVCAEALNTTGRL